MALNSKNGFIGSGIYRCYDGFTHEEGNNVKIEITGALAWSEGYCYSDSCKKYDCMYSKHKNDSNQKVILTRPWVEFVKRL